MRLRLLRTLLPLLVALFSIPYGYGQPQAPDCGACVCAVGGANAAPVIPDPAPVIGGTNVSTLLAGVTYRTFNVTIGGRYRVSLCGNAPGVNSVMHIRRGAVPAAVIPTACDDDGCGVSAGWSSVTFDVAVAGPYRAYYYNTACPTAIVPALTVSVTYLGPVPVPVNDDPCGALPFNLPLPNNCSAASEVGSTTLGATPTIVSGMSVAPLTPTTQCLAPPVNYAGSDVWFRTPLPPSGMLGIQTTDGANCAGGIALYSIPPAGSCIDPYTMLAGNLCSIEGVNLPSGGDAGVIIDGFALGLVAGQVVYIRYWERNNNERGTFSICAYEPLRPPYDNPCTAPIIGPLASCVPVEYNTENCFTLDPSITTAPAITCVGPVANHDVWFRVVVPASGAMTIEGQAGTITDMAMAWYRLTAGSACGPGTMTQIACDNNSGPGSMPRINSQTYLPAIAPPLLVGETIYVRLWNQTNNLHGTFSLCVVQNLPPPNDNPCGAINLNVTPTCEPTPGTTESASGTTPIFPGGTIGGAVPGCGGPITTDVWYTVTVPTDLVAPFGIAFQTSAGVLLDAAFQIYAATGSCATSNLALTPIGACTANGTGMPNLTLNVPTITPGQQLYVRVWREVAPDGDFTICAVRTDPVPCVGSITDPGGPNADYGNNQLTTNTYCAAKAGDVVTLTFSQFDLEAGWDFLTIYDGVNTAAPLLGIFTGQENPGAITASISALNPNGCLTVVFDSDFIITEAGYVAKITCGPAGIPVVNPPGICGDQVYDPGGVAAPYPDNVGNLGNPVWTATYCPTGAPPGSVVTLDFSQFNVEAGWDHLYIYDGPTNAFPLISSGNPAGFAPNIGPGAWWGNGIPDISATTANGGCLTLVFMSDASVVGNWQATVNCGPPPPPPPPPGTTCGTTFYDPGVFGNYANNIDQTTTICAPVGQVVSVDFTSFNTEANWDRLYVYDGPTASPIIPSGNGPGLGPGAAVGPNGFWGSQSPGTVVSSGNCLTFRFISDASVIASGWSALITCAPQSPNNNPCPPFGATVLPVGTSCTFTNSNNTYASSTPGITNSGCGNYQGGDVWFSFTSPPDGAVLLTTNEGTMVDGAMALYSAGSCAGPFTLVECDDDDGQGNMPEIDRRCNTLAPNTVYYVRFWGYAGQRGSFDICATQGYTAEPQGDCLGAFTLCTGDPVSGGFTNPGCATDLSNINWGCLTGGERIGSWYAFAANTNGTLGMTITPNANEDFDWAIWGPFPAGNTMSTLCPLAGVAPRRCSFTSAYTTDAVTGTYATGMGSAAYAAPQYGLPATIYSDVNADGWTPGFSGVTVGDIFIMFVNDYHHSTSGYNVTWQMGQPNMLDCNILPVELLELEAHPRTSTVDLTWSTASEQNNSHFIVERSGDGERFEQIGTVDAVGNTQQRSEYAFTDRFPLMGVNYYRVVQVDFDGASAQSNMVSAEFKQRTEVIVVPNPARENAELVFSEVQEEVLLLRITDSGGRAVAETRSQEGVQRVTLPIEKLERGTYFVRITTLDGTPHGVTPFVKQ